MDVGAIGGGMAMGGAAGMGAAGAANAAGPAATGAQSIEGGIAPGGASPPTTVGEALAGSMHNGIEQLAEFLEGFSIAEIIIALMLMAGSQKEDDEKSSGGAAFAFLAGMAMASQLGQNGQFELNSPVPEAPSGGGVGANLNATA